MITTEPENDMQTVSDRQAPCLIVDLEHERRFYFGFAPHANPDDPDTARMLAFAGYFRVIFDQRICTDDADYFATLIANFTLTRPIRESEWNKINETAQFAINYANGLRAKQQSATVAQSA